MIHSTIRTWLTSAMNCLLIMTRFDRCPLIITLSDQVLLNLDGSVFWVLIFGIQCPKPLSLSLIWSLIVLLMPFPACCFIRFLCTTLQIWQTTDRPRTRPCFLLRIVTDWPIWGTDGKLIHALSILLWIGSKDMPDKILRAAETCQSLLVLTIWMKYQVRNIR
jgi:hypothetical protein